MQTGDQQFRVEHFNYYVIAQDLTGFMNFTT